RPDSEPEATSEPVEDVAEQPVSEKQPTAQLRTYVVQPGDNLFRISLRYNFPTQYVAQANGIVDWDRVHPGQVIVIPDPVPTSISRCEDTTYVVKRGDTLWRIANAFGVGTWQIAKANGLADPNKIKAGALLRIPNTTNCSP
ncbi:MAG: LysM domain-containing protein, partial [Chloroflexota bacterium]